MNEFDELFQRYCQNTRVIICSLNINGGVRSAAVYIEFIRSCFKCKLLCIRRHDVLRRYAGRSPASFTNDTFHIRTSLIHYKRRLGRRKGWAWHLGLLNIFKCKDKKRGRLPPPFFKVFRLMHHYEFWLNALLLRIQLNEINAWLNFFTSRIAAIPEYSIRSSRLFSRNQSFYLPACCIIYIKRNIFFCGERIGNDRRTLCWIWEYTQS